MQIKTNKKGNKYVKEEQGAKKKPQERLKSKVNQKNKKGQRTQRKRKVED